MKKRSRPQSFAAWIRKLRGTKSRAVFAKELGVHWCTVYDWERAGRLPSYEKAVLLSSLSGRPVFDILQMRERERAC